MVHQQATITMSGYVSADPIEFGRNGGTTACSLRIANTPSYYHAEEKHWVDKPTTWMTVKAYRNLASNVLQSVHKGDAIVVCGILNTEAWQKDGSDYSRVILEASAIGHDLNRGTTQFTKHANQSNSNQPNNINKTWNDNIEKSNSNSQSVNKEFDSDLDI
ncbi:single-strand binding family protein [Gardnerella vaginalis]|uniref:Single-stranded DNA-binding protein n=1 Tax=Gardnerella vaginalis TaxID=2702 RepID=A0A135ZBC2_GARVA|nr:single-stranded DNA-binding protein [Gardnerella vaginalis]KXI18960.1 single-strand binding family protein [Gardnerella vaginalis]